MHFHGIEPQATTWRTMLKPPEPRRLCYIKQKENTSHLWHLSSQIRQVWLKHCHATSSFPPPPSTTPPIPDDYPKQWSAHHATRTLTTHGDMATHDVHRHQPPTTTTRTMLEHHVTSTHTRSTAGEDGGDEVMPSPGKQVKQYFTLPLLVQRTPSDFRRTLPFPMDSADSPLEVHWSPLDMTGFHC